MAVTCEPRAGFLFVRFVLPYTLRTLPAPNKSFSNTSSCLFPSSLFDLDLKHLRNEKLWLKKKKIAYRG